MKEEIKIELNQILKERVSENEKVQAAHLNEYFKMGYRTATIDLIILINDRIHGL